MAKALDRPARRDIGTERDSALVQPGRRADSQRVDRTQRAARRGDRGFPRRGDAGGDHAGTGHAGASACGTVAVRLGELRTEWMNGIQFYLETDQPLTDGHAIYLDSNWALTSISQRQFWRNYDLSNYGNGRE